LLGGSRRHWRGEMARARVYLAAGTIAAALVLASGGAVAAADTTGDSAGSDNTTNSTADAGNAPASDHSVEANTLSSGGNEKAASDPAPNPVESSGGDAKDPAPTESSDEPVEKKPVEHDPGTHDNPGDKSINRVPLRPEAPPLLRPEAPPPLDLVPLPEAPPAILAPLPAAPPPALETPPPADLPPTIPAAPVDPDTVDSIDGEARHRAGGNEPPVLTLPVLIARAPIPPNQLLGASIASRWTSSGSAVAPTPRWSGDSAPRLLRASSDQRPLPEPWLKSIGLTAREQMPYRSGYAEYSARALVRTATGALPGLAGLVMMTACGVCLGYRQAKMAQQLRADGLDRFL
jgi:hypothetical protein